GSRRLPSGAPAWWTSCSACSRSPSVWTVRRTSAHARNRLLGVQVPLTVADFLDRAELVYGRRLGVVDEPDQPAESWGELTYAQMAELARAQAAGLDRLGVAQGERVAKIGRASCRGR